MQTLSHTLKGLGIAMLFSIALPVFAESAPVYDADAMPQQQFENPGDPNDNAAAAPQASADEETFAPTPSSSNQAGGNSEQRLHRLEQQMTNLEHSDVSNRVESLQSQMQALRDQVEQLTHQLQTLQSQKVSPATNETAKHLSQNAAKKPQATDDADEQEAAAAQPNPKKVANADKTEAAPAAAPAPADQPNVAEEQKIYQTAYDQIKAKKYDEAVSTLQGMLKKYPSGQFASNAHYWLGELYGLMGKNDQALAEFNTILSDFPDSPRVSDAQLKVGLIYASQSKWIEAKNAFRKVVTRFPGTSSSRVASENLKQIKQAGN